MTVVRIGSVKQMCDAAGAADVEKSLEDFAFAPVTAIRRIVADFGKGERVAGEDLRLYAELCVLYFRRFVLIIRLVKLVHVDR